MASFQVLPGRGSLVSDLPARAPQNFIVPWNEVVESGRRAFFDLRRDQRQATEQRLNNELASRRIDVEEQRLKQQREMHTSTLSLQQQELDIRREKNKRDEQAAIRAEANFTEDIKQKRIQTRTLERLNAESVLDGKIATLESQNRKIVEQNERSAAARQVSDRVAAKFGDQFDTAEQTGDANLAYGLWREMRAHLGDDFNLLPKDDRYHISNVKRRMGEAEERELNMKLKRAAVDDFEDARTLRDRKTELQSEYAKETLAKGLKNTALQAHGFSEEIIPEIIEDPETFDFAMSDFIDGLLVKIDAFEPNPKLTKRQRRQTDRELRNLKDVMKNVQWYLDDGTPPDPASDNILRVGSGLALDATRDQVVNEYALMDSIRRNITSTNEKEVDLGYKLLQDYTMSHIGRLAQPAERRRIKAELENLRRQVERQREISEIDNRLGTLGKRIQKETVVRNIYEGLPQRGGGQQEGTARLPTVRTQDEFNALPSGSRYIDSETGSVSLKP